MENIKCIDVMENLGYINLIDHNNNIWDPKNLTEFQHPHANDAQLVNGGDLVGEEPRPLDELRFMFLEWLKSNKPNRSSDSKHLGRTEDKKQLMKLVIEWASCQFPFNYQEPVPNPNIFDPVPSPSHNFATNDNSINNDNNKYSSNGNFPNGRGCDETEDQVPDQNCDGSEKLVYLSSWVTNVARKKRMARRNWFLPQNCNLHSNSQGHKFNEKRNVNKQCRPGEENRANEDGWQGRKSEKKLMFLLRKVLTQSDVGNSGRIVLPKVEYLTNKM